MKRYNLALLFAATSWAVFLSPFAFKVTGFLVPMVSLGSSAIGIPIGAGAISHNEPPKAAAILAIVLSLSYPTFFAFELWRGIHGG